MSLRDLVGAVLVAAEKGACIARACRAEAPLLQLLVEEKTAMAGKRFTKDFKTLADVLIQEMLRHDLSQTFPLLRDSIFGEETTHFTNTRGESVDLAVQRTVQETEALLATILEGHAEAARLLAAIVHSSPTLDKKDVQQLANIGNVAVDTSNLGIWIDPIDGTNTYIRGGIGEKIDGIVTSGLPTATVLIGGFDKRSGEPIFGVINQPFHTSRNSVFRGRHVWGVCSKDVRYCTISDAAKKKTTKGKKKNDNNIILLISESEAQETKDFAASSSVGAKVICPSAAGYKLLCVAEGLADGYFLSKASSFKWDTCAAHAILRALGGDVVEAKPHFRPLSYHRPDGDVSSRAAVDRWANASGFVAFSDATLRPTLLQVAQFSLTGASASSSSPTAKSKPDLGSAKIPRRRRGTAAAASAGAATHKEAARRSSASLASRARSQRKRK